ncbi:MAG: cellulase family glycosylhydrolase, partial [Anaerolineae bacterium]|nr:cellulase family glycosylhydrolase [Anaerolineae bacterium]
MFVWRSAAKLMAALAALLLVVAVASLLAWRPLIRPWMYARVGEKNTDELIKGTVAYLYLQLTQPLPDLQPYAPIAYASEAPFGVNTFLEQEVEPAKVARSLDLIRDAGFRFVRQEFPWEDIEIAGKGDFWDHKWNKSAWEKYDRIVEMAEERGLQLIVRLDHPPAWTRADGIARGYFAPPDRVEDLGDFVAAVVGRYRGRVRYYQIWNEPNIYPEWGEQPVDARGYTRLLQEAYRRAKEADPDCVILSAGLAQTTEMGPRNLSDLVYLQQMYDAGARDYFDILGVQAYGIWTGPTDHRVSPDRTNFARVQLTRAIMVKNGDA